MIPWLFQLRVQVSLSRVLPLIVPDEQIGTLRGSLCLRYMNEWGIVTSVLKGFELTEDCKSSIDLSESKQKQP